jgi:hypothetical protein
VTFVVDTNVLVVANGREAGHATPECVLQCERRLLAVRTGERIALDTSYEILNEYFRKQNFSGQPGPGDAFAKWAFNNQWNATHCDLVEITRLSDGSYREFPTDPQLARFHLKDRKFVAVSIAHPERPPILNAVDSDWDDFLGPLAENGVVIHGLCA